MTTLKAETRDKNVKAKRLRREGYVTGNVFGREITGSIPVKIGQREVERLLKTSNKGSQLMLEVDGKTYDVLIKEIDYDAMKNQVTEIDFQALVSNEKVHSVAEVVIHNQSKVVTGVVEELLSEIEYKALPSALVEKVIVDVGDLKVGETIKVKDLDIAKDKDVKLITDPEADVAGVAAVHNDVPETDEEEAAALMGAKGWTIFSKITFPHIKWALLYGIVLCTARAMGEFGAVSVLSGHLRGLTNTLPLHVEILFNEFQYVPAFAVSSVLVIMAVILLIIRSIMEHRGKKEEA